MKNEERYLRMKNKKEHIKDDLRSFGIENIDDWREAISYFLFAKELEDFERIGEKDFSFEDIEDFIFLFDKKINFPGNINFPNIREYGIYENELTERQKKTLKNIYKFSKRLSLLYQTFLRVLMKKYQKKNPNFNDEIIEKIKDRFYDLPRFFIYSKEKGEEFLKEHEELERKKIFGDFLLNFNLPKPFGRFWYKGGKGDGSISVKDGQIEWGDFYRRTMPIIWKELEDIDFYDIHLERINAFGQHDHRFYYYLWDVSSISS